MNYTKIFSDKTNVDYFIYENNVFFKEENCIIRLDENLNRKVFFTKDIPFVIVGIIDKELCIRDKSSLSYIELESEIQSKVIPLNFQNSIQIKYQKNNFVVLRNQINEVEWEIFCINNYGSIVWKKNDSKPFFAQGDLNNSVMFSFIEDKKISVIDINDGLTKWKVSFAELIQSEDAFLYDKVINIEDKIFFNVAGSSNGGLFCVDLQNGVIIKKYSGFSRPIFQDEDCLFTTDYENILCKIDSNTLEMKKWNADELVKKNGFDNIHDHRCAAKNGLFYFTQTLGDNKAKFGVLDFNNKQLIYKYEFETKNGGISSIEVSEDRIFIHTQDNTLHIFEKNE